MCFIPQLPATSSSSRDSANPAATTPVRPNRCGGTCRACRRCIFDEQADVLPAAQEIAALSTTLEGEAPAEPNVL